MPPPKVLADVPPILTSRVGFDDRYENHSKQHYVREYGGTCSACTVVVRLRLAPYSTYDTAFESAGRCRKYATPQNV